MKSAIRRPALLHKFPLINMKSVMLTCHTAQLNKKEDAQENRVARITILKRLVRQIVKIKNVFGIIV